MAVNVGETRERALGESGSERALLIGAGVLAVVTILVGVLLSGGGTDLGTTTPPFVGGWLPQIDPAAAWALPLLALAGAGLVALARGAADGLARPRPVAFAAALAGLALLAALAANAARTGTHGWWAVFDLGPTGSFEAKNEYLPGLPALSYGAGFFLDRFAELVPSLPVNVAGHPPGLLLVVDAIGITDGRAFAALCAAGATAIAPLTYALGRTLALPEAQARAAGLLAAASPVTLLFGVASADAIYAALGLGAAILLARRDPASRVAGAVALAVGAFFSWALLAIGAWAAILAWRRERWRAALALAALCGVAVLGSQAALAAATGYDPIGTLRATEVYYRNSLARIRPYEFWVLGSPVAFLVTLGPPIAAAWLVALRRGGAAALAIGAVILIATVGGFTKAETERIWLPFVGLVCVAAATVLPARWLPTAMVALVVQAAAWSLLFETVW